ncbi:hypothetical protein KC19_2G047600 [Ceratodon purpureus]|uniref:La-related protein 6B n=1 Tax=Ceratodon purpureus TaxID=3225 RepID=A0A8T0IU49_CERPU|nr:hypothetical protein KC19_2G047600 [Ceratodon purpureus]
MAPSAAAPAAQHRSSGRSPFGAADVAVAVAPLPMVAAPPPAAAAAAASSAANHHHHHHHHPRRAGAPLSAPSVVGPGAQGAPGSGTQGAGTPPMDVVHHQHHRRTSSTSSSALPVPPHQGGDGRKVQLLSRSLSGSRLNAGAPAFVPKGLQIAFSTSLPGPGQGLGFSPPALVQAPSSVIPVIIPPPVVVSPAVVVPAPSAPTQAGAKEASVPQAEEPVSESPPSIEKPSIEKGSAKEEADGGEVVAASGHGGEGEQGQGPAATVAAGGKPVVTEELKAKIVKQVEFYFSDTNLPTDNYLMKFVKKDPEGFVPIPVVASFRKIKNLVKNHGVVAAALRNSTQLVVSEDGKKVRRVQPLPDVDLEEVQSRTVVAENLPKDHSVESVEELFGKVGPVKMVRICSPEAANGANSTAAKHPKTDMLVSNKLHALVEYESVELAEKAVAELTDERNWRSGLRVRLLLRRQAFQSKHSYQQAPHQRARKPSMDGELAMDEEEGMPEKSGERGHERSGEEYGGPQHQADRGDDFMGGESGDAMGKKGRGRGRGGRTGGGRGRGLHHTHSGTPPQNSSLYLLSETIGKPPPGPRMPDGTRGFSTGRGKLLAVNTSVNTVA